MNNPLQEFLKLTANEDRFRIMFIISQKELCVCQISNILKLSQPTVSKNLSKLRDTQFVSTTRDGKFTYYSFKSDDSCVNDFLANIAKHINDYPSLKKDSQGLINKEQYLNSCSK